MPAAMSADASTDSSTDSSKKKKTTRKKTRTKQKKAQTVAAPSYDRNDYQSTDEMTGRLQLIQNKLDARISKSEITNILDLSASRAQNAFRFDFTSVPTETFNMSSLKELWLTNNKIPVLTHEICALTNLKTLGLAGNQLTGLPPDIGALQKLERLFVDRNMISSIPLEIAHLKKLVELRLDHNHIHHFPEIAGLRSIRRLGLSYNKISKVPAEISRLSNLIELDLDNNQISELPQELARLRMTLQQLGLSNNLLGEKPAFLDQLPELCIVRLSGNRRKSFDSADPTTGEALLGANMPVRHDGFKKTNVEGHLACAQDYNLDSSLFGSNFVSGEYRKRLLNRKNLPGAPKYAV